MLQVNSLTAAATAFELPPPGGQPRVLFDTSFHNSLHCARRLIENASGEMASAGPARRAERKRAGSSRLEARHLTPVRMGEFTEPLHSLHSLGHFVGRDRFAAAAAGAVVCAPGLGCQNFAAGQARAPPPAGPFLWHLYLSRNFISGQPRRPGVAFLLRRMPRPLSAFRAAGGRRITDSRRRIADGQRQ